MGKVIWTDTAIFDLNEIGEYISKDSERYAQLTVERLFNAVDILEEQPRIGKMVPEFQNDKLRELIRLNYRIVYHLVDTNRIDIITVHRCERLVRNAFDFPDFDTE
ncbi:addiction module toxin, RelE/StbE family [Cyclobacterium xiamenense]|uniref:Addiction module toxin, RelE/StbE family n=1 Tax=Cyclobacterium xiamenense TaxID=1297121 RepID=A0A1H6ZBE5_9BACT|nr:type II toxin-antitoxin system RelE/ParE family toxin [Cyclobacterium xiamenense]SEJ50883.1 addiction module toxin, RelE/StbE family [Cyclobacterium xiamenense]